MKIRANRLAIQWCILNSWGWPADIPLGGDRHHEMVKIEERIGRAACLTEWNNGWSHGERFVEHPYRLRTR